MNKSTRIIVVVIVVLIALWLTLFRNRSATTTQPQPINSEYVTYESPDKSFTLQHPKGFSVDEKFVSSGSQQVNIPGIKFSIPEETSRGTNLSTDSYMSVERLPQTSGLPCEASSFLERTSNPLLSTVVKESGVTYKVASSSDAAAGNRYDSFAYVIGNSQPCTAVHYFIHYGYFGNYEAGSVKEFDEAALLSTFDAIRHSLVFKK